MCKISKFMKTRFSLLAILIFLSMGCQKDKGPVDQTDQPDLPDTVVVDTPPDNDPPEEDPPTITDCPEVPIPNQFFPDAVGDQIEFEDELGTSVEVVTCTQNIATNVYQDLGNAWEGCVKSHEAIYNASAFGINPIKIRHWEVPNSYQLDYGANFSDYVPTMLISLAAIEINGKTFEDALMFQCRPGMANCPDLKFVYSYGHGLVALQPLGQTQWWTRKE